MKKKSEEAVEFYIDHETRIRILENAFIDINKNFNKMDSKLDMIRSEMNEKSNIADHKMENKFNMLVALIVTSIILPICLHALHWI